MTKTLNLRNTKKLPITDDIRKVYDAAYAKKNREEGFKAVAQAITPWLRRLVSAYKERGVFPITPAILGDFYKEHNDKVIATLIGCVCVNSGKPETIMAEVKTMRTQMGEHPWRDFIVGRKFVLMSLADVLDNSIGGIGSMRFWQVARLCASLYATHADSGGKMLEDIFRHRVTVNGMAPISALGSMVDLRFVRNADYRFNLALMALCGRDGISYRLWNPDGIEERIRIPEDNTVNKFANMLMPSYKKQGFTTEEVADMVAATVDVDEYGNLVYGTSLAVEIPRGYVGLIFPRSSVCKKQMFLTNCVGVIDSGYRGEIMAKFKYTNGGILPEKGGVYGMGDRIAQLIIMPYPEVEFEEVEELSDSDRGNGGYGSTGK